MYINESTEEKFTIGWILRIITNYVYETRMSGKPKSIESLTTILKFNLNTFKSLSKKYPRYKKVSQLLESII